MLEPVSSQSSLVQCIPIVPFFGLASFIVTIL